MKKTQVEQESRIITGAHGVAAEEDHLILGKVVSVGVISLIIFAVGGVWAWRIQVATMNEQLPEGPTPRPAAMGQYEIGIVNQRLFQQDFHAEQKIAGQQQALRNGWGDQPGTAAHPNLEQAMERVISDARRAPPPPPPAPAPEAAPAPVSPSPSPKR
ncbi:hypothetical protein SAMN05444354_10812 [Stigmatella aurantiaca]|uniref:Uncharacterized protein n=1 Tax=Stigmatella aurantiaca TaxID=41 RepID=A0A1H7SJH7_STIAU|nr:hypothetical protein [Stigmatella aurantiaca]SEL72683.1 hypothetical protein SAMN05444354_10812 [Stigmatella aurantiaca]